MVPDCAASMTIILKYKKRLITNKADCFFGGCGGGQTEL
jgi:hypothetical protein